MATAQADHFDFLITYDGVSATVDGNSDPILGTVLTPGDTFFLDIHAEGADCFEVDANGTGGMGIYASFFVQTAGTRFSDHTATFFLDGVQVAQQVRNSYGQSSVHIGAQDFSLTGGLVFDQLVVDYDFTSTTAASTTIQNDGLAFSPFYNRGDISYISKVPEPGSLLLLVTSMGIMGVMVRRRREQRSI